jgi:mannose-6-phosphate isomerase
VLPMRMQPVLLERVWGGRRLAEFLGKPVAHGTLIGESWELADFPEASSRVAEGPLAGQTLHEVLNRHGMAVLGREIAVGGDRASLGLLVKFLDASERLSVQVHPDDTYAAAHEIGQSGKDECWVVMHAESGAWLAHGLKPGTTREQVAAGVLNGQLEQLLVVSSCKTGDVVWVPAGTVHAIGPGIVLAEVQQSSDVTYRLYDWGRAGLDGRPRHLHIRQALEVLRLPGEAPPAGGRGRTVNEAGRVIDHLVDSATFSLSRLMLDRRSWTGGTAGAMAAVVVLAGSARLTTSLGFMDIRIGDTVLVPAAAAEYRLDPAEPLTVLVAAPPGKAPQR